MGSQILSMNVEKFVKSSFRKLGVYSSGDNPTVTELEDALEQLNDLLSEWSIRPDGPFQFLEEAFTVGGAQNYTYGTGGDFDSERPTRIIDCYYRVNDIDSRVLKTTVNNWVTISAKHVTGYPRYFLYNATYPLGTVSFYPVPDSTSTVTFFSIKPLAKYDNLSDEVSLPHEYIEAIKWNLAKKMSSEFFNKTDPVVMHEAEMSYKYLVDIHRQNKLPPQISTDITRNIYNTKYNIYSDYC